MNDPCRSEGFPSRAQRRLGTYTWTTLSFSVFCNFQTRMPIRRPPKCSVPMLWTMSSKGLRMRASQAVHWRVSSGEDTWTAGTLGFLLERRDARHDADRCGGRKSDAPTALPRRVWRSPSLSGEKRSLASTCLTLQRFSMSQVLHLCCRRT